MNKVGVWTEEIRLEICDRVGRSDHEGGEDEVEVERRAEFGECPGALKEDGEGWYGVFGFTQHSSGPARVYHIRDCGG